MRNRTIKLAQQLLTFVPQQEVTDLVKLLDYYNRFRENERALGMSDGSKERLDPSFEDEVKTAVKPPAIVELSKANQDVYVTSSSIVCRFCGK